MNKIIKIDADTVTIAKADGTFAFAPRTSLSFEPSLNDVVDIYQVGDDIIVNQAAASSPVQPAEAVSGFQQEPAPTVEVQQEQVVNPGAGQQAQFAQSQEAYQAQGQFNQSAQAGNFQQGQFTQANPVYIPKSRRLAEKKLKQSVLIYLIYLERYYWVGTYLGLFMIFLIFALTFPAGNFIIFGVIGTLLELLVNFYCRDQLAKAQPGSWWLKDGNGYDLVD